MPSWFSDRPTSADLTDDTSAGSGYHADTLHGLDGTALNQIKAVLGATPEGGSADLTVRLTALDALVAGMVTKALFDANTILAATADNTPLAVTMGPSTILARLASGDIVAATPGQLRTLLALVIGTNTQAWDADLDSIAGLTSAANKMLYATGAQTWALADLTAAGRAILDDADAAAQRVTLGVIAAVLTTNAQSGTTYTLVLADADKLVEMANAAAITLTVPTNTVAYPVGTQIHLLQTGAGQVTVVGDSGVTVNGTPGLKFRAQWSAATLIKRSTTVWVLTGDLSA